MHKTISKNKSHFETNRNLWNLKTQVHIGSDFYELEAFKKGKNVLRSVELAEVGNVYDKSLLHFQCHFGLDTMSWSRLGAHATGIDISDKAIEIARKLNKEIGSDAKFVRCNLYDLKKHLDGEFDIIYSTYGTIGWLPDLTEWAGIIKHFLKPGGFFYLAEFHPVVWMFDNNFTHFQYSYFNEEPIIETVQGTYADPNSNLMHQAVSWNHGLGEVISALCEQGLRIDFVHEFDSSPYNCFNNTIEGPDGHFRIKGLENKIPMMYSIKASKPV